MDDSVILEAIEQAQAKAIEIVGTWNQPEAGGQVDTPAPTTAKRTETEARNKAYGEAMLEACRVEVDAGDGYETYEAWRSRTPGYEGRGAITLLRLWRKLRQRV